MNKKMKKWLPYIFALCSVGSVFPLNEQITFANESQDYKRLEKLKKVMEICKSKWLNQFAEFQELKDSDGNTYYKWTIQKDADAYKAFSSAWTNEPNKDSDEHIAWEAIKKVTIEPYIGIYSGVPYNPSASWTDEGLVKCLESIETEVKKIIYNDAHPLSNSAYQVIGDIMPAVVAYAGLSTVGYKALGVGEKIFDSYADRYFENKFSGREQRAEDKRSKDAVLNLDWDFDSLPCDLIRKELFDTLVPMYPYAETEIDDYITTLVGIIKQKQKNPNSPTVIINVHGDPGCGKSTLIKLTMKILAKYNSINENAKALFITPSESQNSTDSTMVDRCFGTYSTVINGRRIKRDSPFASCLKYTQNFITVLDDIDKLETKNSGGGVFKILWNIADGGLLDGFPTSKVLFLSTANSDLTQQTSSVSGSQSTEAMLSRIKNIHFPNPDSAAYQKSFMSDIKKINDDESCKVLVPDSVLKLIGDHCVKVRKGMREKNSLIIKLRGLLVKADSNGWKNAEVKFLNDKLSIVELKEKNKEVPNEPKEDNVSLPVINKEMEKNKNVSIIASANVNLDKKINDRNATNLDKLTEKLKNKGVNIDNLLEKLQRANLDIYELTEDINNGKLDLDNLNVDISNIDLLVKKLKKIYDLKNRQHELNGNNNVIEMGKPIMVES